MQARTPIMTSNPEMCPKMCLYLLPTAPKARTYSCLSLPKGRKSNLCTHARMFTLRNNTNAALLKSTSLFLAKGEVTKCCTAFKSEFVALFWFADFHSSKLMFGHFLSSIAKTCDLQRETEKKSACVCVCKIRLCLF